MSPELLDWYLNSSYEEIVNHFQIKYGVPTQPYFMSESCKQYNKSIKRTGEGLYIHHIQEIAEFEEYFMSNLSQPVIACQVPFEWQQPNNLCYCNLLEHYLLHVKINLSRVKSTGRFIRDGVLTLGAQIKNLYLKDFSNTLTDSEKKIFEPIKEEYKAFVKIHNYWVIEVRKLVDF
mgnify:CR=1 FL=1